MKQIPTFLFQIFNYYSMLRQMLAFAYHFGPNLCIYNQLFKFTTND